MYRIGEEEIQAVSRVIKSKQLFRINDEAKEVEHFEKEWAEKIGTKYSLCVSGGTSAIACALAGLGIGPGDEVIIPSYTFIATAFAVLQVGAIPVIVEIDDTLTIDLDDIKKKISPYTKAIIPVHMAGLPCNMDEIMKIARENKLKVIEDACQADGGSYKGRRLGSIGDVGTFSFNYYKILTAGEGGAITTDIREVYERALIYHDGGTSFRPYAKKLIVPIFAGFQYRSNEISGAILREQLKKLDGILHDARVIKKQFMDELIDEANIEFARSNDIEGDCGIHIPFRFNSEKQARQFSESEGVEGWLPIDSDRHVYTNWTPLLEKRGAFHPNIDPYKSSHNKGRNMNYSKNMCLVSLDILKRTVYVSVDPDWSEDEINKRITYCRNAARNIKA